MAHQKGTFLRHTAPGHNSTLVLKPTPPPPPQLSAVPGSRQAVRVLCPGQSPGNKKTVAVGARVGALSLTGVVADRRCGPVRSRGWRG